MHIVICGRMRHAAEIRCLSDELNRIGYGTTIPQGARIDPPPQDLRRDEFRYYFGEIAGADAVLVLNINDKERPEGYIGGNTFLEMGFAHVMSKPIILVNDFRHNSLCYVEEINRMNPAVLAELPQSNPLYHHLVKIKSATDKLFSSQE